MSPSKEFFDRVRNDLFGGSLSVGQVEGCRVIMTAFDGCDARWLAYALATAFHETARTMQPISEYGDNDRFERLYGPTGQNPTRAKKMGNTMPGDGIKYRGRGYVQLTWKANYQRASKVTGIDLVKDPDRAKDTAVAAIIMRNGMEQGWFTGKKLRDYFAGAKSDWKGARKIINGTDKDELIAGYARKFYGALVASVPEDLPTPKGKPQVVSTTQAAATTVGAAVAIGQIKDSVQPVKEALAAVNELGEAVSGVTNISGWVLLAITLLGIAWIMRERWRKSNEYGV
jgi:hypothetical protein